MKNFSGKVAAITGAASGMGRQLAIRLAERGCHVAISDVNAAELEITAERARAYGVRVTTRSLDVSDRAAMQSWADDTAAEHGKVNLIFNNAGVALSSTMEGVRYDDFEWIMAINFWGVVYGTKAFMPYLKAAGEGHVINTSSVFGLCSQPGMGGYNASKFAVRGFTESLRQELDLQRCGVSATSVHPGGIKTNIARAGRVDRNIEGLLVKDSTKGAAQFEKLFITTADSAALTILKAVQRDARRVLVGPDAHLIDWMVRCFPSFYQAIVAFLTKRFMRKV
ncbi:MULTISPECIES: SDR family NAD(P)-dependent oxidoreductase [Hydrocarboniphaga]|jgi:NAD(P)-dependent dehydrogenase (short-subunit alcohol dehydrogenase family)|uniref:Short-chain dehydrogenase/reductase SDR n=1 Tax=Hydrocarboniphaga effusa AP103 TaxID=1172194 RepID=I8I4C2_9GAMM|nr:MULTISPECIES: SDR family oxidoreductase [Hydrocarboniphaga]EIT71031.1 short-chain dehydrogenase/reductase SDR [Hydrocarboniphaga effusa AP103]MDZ4079097.1 SDR family oxidoreductase [Hydrocarboniphaga sp.]